MNPEITHTACDAPDREMAQRLEVLVDKSERLRAELKAASVTRWCLAIVLLVFVMAVTSSFVSLGRHIGSQKNVAQMVEIARTKWEARAPEYQRDIQGMIERSTPILTNAVVAQFKADMPKLLQASTAERGALADGFAKGLEERVRGRYRELLAERQTALLEEFPEFTDEKQHERILANLTLAVDELVERHYVANIQRTVEELVKNWDEFPAADSPKPGDDPVQDQLLAEFSELISLRLSKTDPTEALQQ